jgi:hypothetical protein
MIGASMGFNCAGNGSGSGTATTVIGFGGSGMAATGIDSSSAIAGGGTGLVAHPALTNAIPNANTVRFITSSLR